MRPDLENLFKTVSRMIGSSELPDKEVGFNFVELLETLTTFDHAVIFAYRGEQRPLDLYSTFGVDEYDIFVSQYLAGPYLLDPFFRAATSNRSGVWRMRELAPDRFFSSEYFRSYYVKTGLAEEIGFFIPITDDCLVVLSLMRKEVSGTFTPAEFTQIRKAEPVVRSMVQHFWRDVPRRFDGTKAGRKKRGPEQDLSLRVWSKLGLTGRETTIIELVLQGHSSESIGLTLQIATGTVKVHRRNVYRKLGIASQTQLLSLYLENLKDV